MIYSKQKYPEDLPVSNTPKVGTEKGPGEILTKVRRTYPVAFQNYSDNAFSLLGTWLSQLGAELFQLGKWRT